MFVKVRVYVSNFVSEIITENIRKLARWISSRKNKSFSWPQSHVQTLTNFLEDLLAILSRDL